MTVNDLIKLLDTEGNRYGGATGKPRELNLSVCGRFLGTVDKAKLDGYGDGLITDVTLEVETSKYNYTNADRIRAMSDEELAECIFNSHTAIDGVDLAFGLCSNDTHFHRIAKYLYDAGYRKARKNHTGTDKVLCSIDYRPVEEVRKETAKEFAEKIKTIFYYEFDEIIPSIMSYKIDELLKEYEE